MVTGNARDHLPPMVRLARDAGCQIVSVEYRLAPEHPYPAAVEDVYAGLEWIAARAAGLAIQPDGIVLQGFSAGAGIAAGVALMARDRGGPALAAQMLLCPMLDDRNDSASGWQMAGAGIWDRTANETGWSAYLGPAPRDAPIYASPGRALDLAGLPPTYIDAGSAETFRDEDVACAQRIWAAGGRAELHVWAGGAHSFEAFAPESRLAKDAHETRARWLIRTLAQRA
jgi:acetyl esterase/lipase